MKRKYLALGAVSAIILGATALTASAYRGNPDKKGPNYNPERHEQMQKAFENKDYNAWKNLMQNRGRVSQVVNENNFARFAEMHRLQLEGKTDEANKIRAELGLGQGLGKGNGKGMQGNSNGQRNFVDANNDGICDNRK